MNLPPLKLSSLSVLRYGPQIRASRDWFLVLGIATALFLISVAWNAWLFYRVESGEALSTAPSQSAATLDTSSLESAKAVFTARTAEQQKYRNTYRFIDPSR